MKNKYSRAFTLIEILVVMAIIIILAAIFIPALTSALDRAKATKDLSNLRQIGLATQLYMNDNNGVLFSTTGSWMSQLYNADHPPLLRNASPLGMFSCLHLTAQPVQELLQATVRPLQSAMESTGP